MRRAGALSKEDQSLCPNMQMHLVQTRQYTSNSLVKHADKSKIKGHYLGAMTATRGQQSQTKTTTTKSSNQSATYPSNTDVLERNMPRKEGHTHTPYHLSTAQNQQTNRPTCLPACLPTVQPINHPSNQPTNQPASQPANCPTNQHTTCPAERLRKRGPGHAAASALFHLSIAEAGLIPRSG